MGMGCCSPARLYTELLKTALHKNIILMMVVVVVVMIMSFKPVFSHSVSVSDSGFSSFAHFS
jgi:hypothetical protein